jgi:acetolactate synthase-1/2/3 large subunit
MSPVWTFQPTFQPLQPRSVPRPQPPATARLELTRLAEEQGIPVVSTFIGKGAISDRSAQSLLSIGTGFRDYVREAVEAADLVMTVGYDIAEYAPDRWNPTTERPIVHIDFAPAEVYGQYQAVEVVGDIVATLRALNADLSARPLALDRGWYEPVRQRIVTDLASWARS